MLVVSGRMTGLTSTASPSSHCSVAFLRAVGCVRGAAWSARVRHTRQVCLPLVPVVQQHQAHP
jgi:hypothetical protein